MFIKHIYVSIFFTKPKFRFSYRLNNNTYFYEVKVLMLNYLHIEIIQYIQSHSFQIGLYQVICSIEYREKQNEPYTMCHNAIECAFTCLLTDLSLYQNHFVNLVFQNISYSHDHSLKLVLHSCNGFLYLNLFLDRFWWNSITNFNHFPSCNVCDLFF